MKFDVAMSIAEACGDLYDSIPKEEFSVWNYFVQVNEIVSQQKGVECLMHVNFANGSVTQGLCVITDWQPVALALQSDEGEAPRLRAIYPEDYLDFMKAVQPIFDVQYPAFPKDQEA